MDDAPALVADIGRQSVRFGLTDADGGAAPRDIRRYSTSDHSTFTSAMIAYLRETGMQDRRMHSVLAVAGATHGDMVTLTGSRWFISLSGVAAVLGERPIALNECAANALALTTLPPDAFVSISGPAVLPPRPGGTFLILTPGTGLGVAALVTAGERLIPVASEAAHMTLAPRTADERRFVEYVAARGAIASNEMLLSAGGLITAYAVAGGTRTVTAPEEVTRDMARDPIARAAVQLFLGHLSALIGDLVLAFGAWDGVFVNGAIARALRTQLAEPELRQLLEAKGPFRRQLAQVPLGLVTRKDLELVGAAAALHKH